MRSHVRTRAHTFTPTRTHTHAFKRHGLASLHVSWDFTHSCVRMRGRASLVGAVLGAAARLGRPAEDGCAEYKLPPRQIDRLPVLH